MNTTFAICEQRESKLSHDEYVDRGLLPLNEEFCSLSNWECQGTK